MSKLTLTSNQKKELNKSVSHIVSTIKNHTFDELVELFKAHNVDKLSHTERSMDFNLSYFCFTINETIINEKDVISLHPYVEVYDDDKGIYLGYTTIVA